jgi:hypothetical protein
MSSVTIFTSVLVTDSKGGRSPFFGFRNCPRSSGIATLRLTYQPTLNNCCPPDQSQSHFTADNQYVLVSSPLCGRLTRYYFIFKSLGLEFVVLSLRGALSHERPGLSFVSHSLVICLCVHLLFTFLSFTFTLYIYRYKLYNTYNIYKASFSPGSVQHIVPCYSLVAHATTAV